MNRNERILIEGFLRAGRDEPWIADQLGRHRRTIEREVERGLTKRIDSELVVKLAYSADRAQDVHKLNASAKGPVVKLKAHSVSLEFIRRHILISEWSPEVVAARMKQKGMEGAVCAKPIYTYIDKGEIHGVSNDSLWEKRMRGKKYKVLHRQAKRGTPIGRSIEDRPDGIANRKQVGHWEIDLVVSGKGKGKAALLTLTERKTRMEIIRKLKAGTQAAVARAINGIERQMGSEAFRVVFKSITADNGSEFLDFQALEKAELDVAKAWYIKELFRHFWTRRDAGFAESFFERWHKEAFATGLPEIRKVARMLKKHLGNILTYFECYITNAASEGLSSKIQAIKANARGFRNFENYRVSILFFCGKLELSP